jgi:hypothetical protein
MTVEKSQCILRYVAIPVTLIIVLATLVAIEINSARWGWPDLTITEKSNSPPGRFRLHATSQPNQNGGTLSAALLYTEAVYREAQVGDTLVFGFCHVRLVRNASIVDVQVHWQALPFLLAAIVWTGFLSLCARKPELLQRWFTFLGGAAGAVLSRCGRWIGLGRPCPAAEVDLVKKQSRTAIVAAGTEASLNRPAYVEYLEKARLLAAPVAFPFLFHLAYQPINAAWTVKRFGCGCPPLDESFRFNANYVNGILWALILVTCTVTWVVRVERALAQWEPLRRAVFGGCGIGGLWFLVLHLYSREIWL